MPGGAGGDEEKPANPCLVAVFVFVFLASGVCQPLVMSQIKYSGLADKTAQLYMVPYYFGMACVGFLYICLPSKRWCQYKVWKPVLISYVDIVGQVLNYTGNGMAGSGLFAVIYASVSIWCGVLSWIVGLRKLTILQWITIFIVFGGLAIAAADAKSGGSEVLSGVILIIIGSILHAVMYVACEYVAVRGGDEKIPPHINASSMGINATVVFFAWNMAYTLPRWDNLIGEPVKQAAKFDLAEPWMLALLVVAVALFNFVHSATFYFLLKWLGSVSCALMKGIQAVAVFVVADPIFCNRNEGIILSNTTVNGTTVITVKEDLTHGDKAQCYTTYKWISLAVVVGGVMAYVVVTQRAKAEEEAQAAANARLVDDWPQASGGDYMPDQNRGSSLSMPDARSFK